MRSKGVNLKRSTAPRVLVAEDNTLIAMDLEDLLKTYGCEIIGPSVSVMEAVSHVEQGGVDIAVIDYLLEDGTAERLAKLLDIKGIPYALCTGVAEREISSLHPNTPILGKPYKAEDVSLVVNSLIASRLAS
jgi:CheY-like chemotaxis protein